MDLDAAHMTVDDRLLQIGGGKIAGIHAGVEGVRAQIYSVSAVADGGAQRLHCARGRKQFERVVLPSSVFKPRLHTGIAIVQYSISQAGERRK